MNDSAARKDDLIQIRASAATKAILNRAAAMRGQKLSEFMLESARARAEETILDQRLFRLMTTLTTSSLRCWTHQQSRIGCCESG